MQSNFKTLRTGSPTASKQRFRDVHIVDCDVDRVRGIAQGFYHTQEPLMKKNAQQIEPILAGGDLSYVYKTLSPPVVLLSTSYAAHFD